MEKTKNVTEKKPVEKKSVEQTKAKKEVKAVESMKSDLMNQPESFFSTAEKSRYQTIVKSISSELSKVEKSYLNIAFKLYAVYEKKLYAIENYQTIYDFAKHTFSLARGTCSNYINIVQQFGEYTVANGNVLTYTGKLDPKYEKFSSSKLIAMLGLPEHVLSTISPDMTVAQIKEIKRDYNDSASALEEKPNKDKIIDTTAKDCEEEPSEDNGLDLTAEEKSSKSIRIATVDSVLTLSESDQTVIADTYLAFKEKYPNKQPKFDICLVW